MLAKQARSLLRHQALLPTGPQQALMLPIRIKLYCLRRRRLYCLYASSSTAYTASSLTACTQQALLLTQQALLPTHQALLPTQRAPLLKQQALLLTGYSASSTAHSYAAASSTAYQVPGMQQALLLADHCMRSTCTALYYPALTQHSYLVIL